MSGLTASEIMAAYKSIDEAARLTETPLSNLAESLADFTNAITDARGDSE